MPDFYLPYHFVPVARGDHRGALDVAELRKGKGASLDGVRHDRYESGKFSGVIACVVKAVSPVFIGHQRNGVEVIGFQLDDQPALPASSLRGMISSIAESASNSALRVLSRTVLGEECYSYRKPMRHALTAIGRLSRKDGNWDLEPLCLPILQYDGKGFLRPEMKKWKVLFPKPAFRVHMGNYGEIRDENTWTPRTGMETNICLHPLAWSDVERLGPIARKHLNIKSQIKNDRVVAETVVAQRQSVDQSAQSAVMRVLGCFEKDERGQELRQIPGNKKHELLLPYPPGSIKKVKVSKWAVDRFQHLANQMTEDSKNDLAPRPYEPKDTRPERQNGEKLEPRDGDLVFFDINDEASEVTEFAYSSIWRGCVETDDHKAANAWTFFQSVDRNLLPFQRQRTKVTLAERLFGFVEEKDGKELRNGLRCKGRVRFSNGLADHEIKEMNLIPLKELSSPKPPSPSLYFRQPEGENRHIAKSDLKPGNHCPHGRKVYLHHPKAIDGNTHPWENLPELFVADRHVQVRPWPKGAMWRFEIRFDNLGDLELGLLVYALKPTAEFLHKLGMGKPLGLGSVRLSIEHVRLINREARYSPIGWGLQRFEAQELDWRKLRDDYRAGMNLEIRAALETLGDPQKLRPDMRIGYPRVQGQTGEEDLYKWFVSNDDQARKGEAVALQPVARVKDKQVQASIDPMPELPPPRGH